jgi:predicted DNA binding CopG/RHH family protein
MTADEGSVRDTLADMTTPQKRPSNNNTKSRQVSFRLSYDLIDALHAMKAAVGIPLSEQIRRALLLWFEQQQEQPQSRSARRA